MGDTQPLAPQSTQNTSGLSDTQTMLNSWLAGKAKAPTQPTQAKRARLLKKLSDLTLYQQQKG